jgi:acyl-CoA thioester hydrolase
MRWSDMDAFQHVNNVVFLTYLEEARVDMLFTLGEQMGLSALREGVVVARHEIDYRRPLVYHPKGVDIDVWVSEIGVGKFVMSYRLYDETTTFAEAKSVMVPFDVAAGRPRRVSPEERAFLERFLDPASS